MQVPLIHMLNHLQKQNPSFLSQIQLIAFSFFKWSALVLALLTTFSVIIITFRRNAPSIPFLITNDDDDYDFSDTDEESDNDNETMSSSEFEDNEEDDTAEDKRRKGECFRVRGETGVGSFLRRRSIADLFSLSEIANIRLGFGSGFGFDDSEEESVVSIYNQEQRIHPVIPTTMTAISSASPSVVVSAGENALGMRIWDTRLRRRMPALIAEWGPTVGETVGVESSGGHKVYVKDDGRYWLTVGDIRNVRLPLEDVTESRVDTWWPNPFIFKLQ